MKLKFTLLCFLFIPFLSKSQIIEKALIERINKSQYIFEGQVIRAKGYWNNDKTYIYTSLTIDIKKIFKGNLICGKVELINEGGEVGDSISLQISHNLILKEGQKGIFLCRETTKELPAIDYYPEENYQKLEATFNEQGYIKYFEDDVNPELWDYQFHLDSLAQAYNLMELYTQLNYVDCYQGTTVFPTVSHNKERLRNPDVHSSIPLTVVATTGDTNITYTLENPQITYSNGSKYFEFDFSISDSTPDIYFAQLVAKITYDTLSFGTLIAGTISNRLETFRGSITSDTVSYYRPHCQNFTRNTFSLVVGVNPPNNNTYVDITEAPQSVAHLKMQIMDCGHPGIVQPTVTTVFANYCLQPDSARPLYGYDTLNIANSLSFGGCANGNYRYITSITPYNVRAGIGDTVTVRGRGFGAIKGNGNVYLPNADNGGSTFVNLDSVDYIYPWTDTIVKFIVPSNLDNTNPEWDTPGSGLLYIQNDSGFAIGSNHDSLIIEYGIANFYKQPYPSKYFPYLSASDTARGFVFRPDTNFTHNSNWLTAFKTAMKSWDCLTTINFKLGTELQTTDTVGVNDGVCTLKLGYDIDSTVIARTNLWIGFQPGGCQKAFLKEMDIVVNRIYTFFADTTSTDSVPSAQADLYQVLLHELGHAHLFTHINDRNSIMWWGTDTTGIPAANRNITIDDELAVINAGNYVMSKANQIDTINCPFLKLESGASGCSHVIGITDIFKPEINLIVYPNPTSNEINIQFEVEKPSKVIFTIKDLSGREVLTLKDLAAGVYHTSIPINNLESGVYLIRFEVAGYTYISKIVKQ